MTLVDRRTQKKRRGQTPSGIIIALLVLVVGAGIAAYYLWPRPAPEPPPPAETATMQEAREYLAGDDFDRLPMEQRIEWLEERLQTLAKMDEDELRESLENMDDEARRRIRSSIGPVMFARMRRSVDDFHKLPESQREAFLDQEIDRMQTFREVVRKMRGPRDEREGAPRPEAQARRAPAEQGQGRGGPPRAGRDGARRGRGNMMNWLSRVPADRRARIISYRKAITNRMKERGIEPPGRRGGRGGGRDP